MRAKALIAVFTLALAACGEPKTASEPQTAAAPEFANNGYVADGPAPGMAVNIHATELGLAGFVREVGGDLRPIRNIVVSNTAMSFIVPAIEASLTATKVADGAWSGIWPVGDASTDIVLKAAPAQDINAQFVIFEDGRWTQFECAGAGSPTVALDYGAGGAMGVWKDVVQLLSQLSRTCMFERAARGLSDPGPMPPDVNHAVADMDAIVRAARIEGSVVLVGHSMASYHVRQYANLH